MVAPYRIAIAGLGTVGAGVVRILQQHDALIAERAGRAIEIVAVSARDRDKDRGVTLDSYTWHDDARALAESDVDAVVELVGGENGPAFDLCRQSLASGKAVVTANKALLAHHGFDLAALAEENNVSLMYEAAVAGGIPVIKTIREGFAGNDIQAVYGILNGTCNYILTEMRETGRDFASILADAQRKGYAEADPAFDVEGVDAAHKLCLLSALAFGIRPDFNALPVQGISNIHPEDIAFAAALGYRVKLLGIAKRHKDGTISQRVEPCLVPEDTIIGAVEGVFNAVYTEADHVGSNLSVGRGAGAGPTASAVLSDIIDLARGYDAPPFGVPVASLSQARWRDHGDDRSRFYLRLVALDKPGVLAEITAIMHDCNVSIESVTQRGHDPDNPVTIIINTHLAVRRDIETVGNRLRELDFVTEDISILRTELL